MEYILVMDNKMLAEHGLYKIIFALLLVFAAFYPSFSVPFYFDDFPSIVENKYLFQTSISQLWEVYGLRFFGYLTFWLNVQLFGAEPLSFHVVNLFIHLLNGILIYWVVRLIAEYFQYEKTHTQLFAIFVALIWLSHPLNTQAVTYIVQRLASLVALFYLLTLISYFKIRLFNAGYQWYLVGVIGCILGMLTKQNFVGVFVFILLFEIVFLKDKLRKNLLITALIALLATTATLLISQDIASFVDTLTRENKVMSRFDYLITQLVVVAHYIAKYFYPVNLQLDMHYELAREVNYAHWLALLFHLTLITSAIILRKNKPLWGLGILFYYSAHIIESSIIPITDMAFEHRTYIPNIGLTIAVVSMFYSAEKRLTTNRAIILILLSLLLSAVTFVRNNQWTNQEKFIIRELSLAPESPRSLASMASYRAKQGYFKESEKLYQQAIQINMKLGKMAVSDMNNLILVFVKQKKYAVAIKTANLALKYIKKRVERSKTLSTLAHVYSQMGNCSSAIKYAKMSLDLDSNNKMAIQEIKNCHG